MADIASNGSSCADALRTAWAAGRPTYGLWTSLGRPTVAALAHTAGYDWLGIEAQHSTLGEADLLATVAEAELLGLPLLVRTRGADPDLLGYTLDLGVDGVIVPMIETADQARELVRATRYPTEGARSFGPGKRAWRGEPMAVAHATRPLVFAMIETAAAVAAAPEIAAVPGLDGLFVGPGDLAVSLGRVPAMAPFDDELTDLIRSVQRAARRGGLVGGIFAGGAENVHRSRQLGFKLLVASSDVAALARGLGADLAAARGRSSAASSRRTGARTAKAAKGGARRG